MLQTFIAGLRESLQCSLLLALLMGIPAARARAGWVFAGVSLAFLSGFSSGFIPGISGLLPPNESWTLLRYATELTVFYLGLAFLTLKSEETSSPAGFFVLGFVLYFFEARALGFLAYDKGSIAEAVSPVLAAALFGAALGFGPLALLRGRLERLKLERFFTFPSLLVSIGALKFAMGGVGEVEGGDILISIERGTRAFMGDAVANLRDVLMISGHGFIEAPLEGLAGFFSGDRFSTSLLVLFVMAPPVAILVRTFSMPDPSVRDLKAAAERRLKISFFRTELLLRSVPPLAAFAIIFVSLHAVNASLNPMFEPVPKTVREAGGEGVLRIPLSGKTGEFADGKLRKYLYYYGDRQVIFVAVLKPDGTLGVALDECEICKPPEWNKAAQGYAQRGKNLVCKYCMTPIPVHSVNKPGGCNPIPLPFNVEEEHIVVTLDDLISVYREAKALDRKGSHL
jgi:uncharacterized membrane protein